MAGHLDVSPIESHALLNVAFILEVSTAAWFLQGPGYDSPTGCRKVDHPTLSIQCTCTMRAWRYNYS